MSESRPAGYDGIEAEAELLPTQPPPRVARALANFLIAAFAGITGFAAFVPLPEAVRCRFVLAAEGGSAPVTASEAGTVEQVLVQLGESVTAGQPLLALAPYVEPLYSPAELKARLQRLQSEKGAAAAIDAQLALRHEARLAEARSDSQRAAAAASAARRRKATMDRLAGQAERAAAEGAVSQSLLLDRQQQMEDADIDLADAQRRNAAARMALQTLGVAREVELKERELVMHGLDGEIAEVAAQLQDIANAATTGVSEDIVPILAPHDGVVVSLPAERPGLVVVRGQPVVGLARPGARLRAEINIPERGAARISQGQTVRLLFDAYPYTRHGVVTGVLSWVSPAAQGGQLAAFARLEDASVVVDDRRRPLRPGMGGEARIDIGSRTLLEYVFEPLQQIREALRPGSAEAG